MYQPVMTAAEVTEFLDREFPQLLRGRTYRIAEIGPGEAVVRFSAGERHLRPGGTVSGPALFALADVGAYVATLAHIGPVALAVTTSLTINFLRKSEPGDLVSRNRLLKLGKSLAVIDGGIFPAGSDDMVAHAISTYSIPPRR